MLPRCWTAAILQQVTTARSGTKRGMFFCKKVQVSGWNYRGLNATISEIKTWLSCKIILVMQSANYQKHSNWRNNITMQETLGGGCLVTSITQPPRGKKRKEVISKCYSFGERREVERQTTTWLGDLPPYEHVCCLRKFSIMHWLYARGFCLEVKGMEGFW